MWLGSIWSFNIPSHAPPVIWILEDWFIQIPAALPPDQNCHQMPLISHLLTYVLLLGFLLVSIILRLKTVKLSHSLIKPDSLCLNFFIITYVFCWKDLTLLVQCSTNDGQLPSRGRCWSFELICVLFCCNLEQDSFTLYIHSASLSTLGGGGVGVGQKGWWV